MRNFFVSLGSFYLCKKTKLVANDFYDIAFNLKKGRYVSDKQNVCLNKEQRKFNVIGIDWHEMAQPPYYYSAAKNTETVGKFIGKNLVIDILINTLNQNPKKIHAIGHSLGAHISGHIGREVEKRKNAKIGRVTGIPQSSTNPQTSTNHLK